MNASKPSTFPLWFQMTCCVVPLAALLAISVGLAIGVSVNPLVAFTLAALAWRVIAQVLGIEQSLISIVVPKALSKRMLSKQVES